MNKHAFQWLIALVFSLVITPSLLADITEVSNDELEKMMAAGVPVIDVRRLDEWEKTGTIDGAHKLTFFDKQGNYDAKKWLSELDKIIGKGEPVILICHAGVRTKAISKLLDKRLGYTSVHNHTRGMKDWLKAGKPVVAHAEGDNS